MEEAKIGLGMGLPLAVAEAKEKDLPKEPTGRSRSGTGKSSKDKKSIFGTITGGSFHVDGYQRLTGTDLLSNDKKPSISMPYDPIHLTHVGFDVKTGSCELACRAKGHVAE